MSEATTAGAVRTSVLIPAYDEEDFLGETLRGVHASFAALSRSDYEIVVCDNNSTDSTAQVARQGGARVVFEPHNQMSLARNAAARAARGEQFIFLDADTTLDPALLAATLQRLESGRVAGGGALVRIDTDRPGWYGTVFHWGWNRLSRIRRLAPGLYIYCLRRVWEGVGGFDEGVYFFEDVFFSRAMYRWGREHGMAVDIIREPKVLTSSRKLQWYSGWRLTRQMLVAFLPHSIKNRDRWGVWYDRPRRDEGRSGTDG